jgi:hypothetical protein
MLMNTANNVLSVQKNKGPENKLEGKVQILETDPILMLTWKDH